MIFSPFVLLWQPSLTLLLPLHRKSYPHWNPPALIIAAQNLSLALAVASSLDTFPLKGWACLTKAARRRRGNHPQLQPEPLNLTHCLPKVENEKKKNMSSKAREKGSEKSEKHQNSGKGEQSETSEKSAMKRKKTKELPAMLGLGNTHQARLSP